MPKISVVSRNLIAYLISHLSVAPFCRSLDPSLVSRTNKYFARGHATLPKTSNKDLSGYIHFKAVPWYRQQIGS